MPMPEAVYEIDGRKIGSIEDFYNQIEAKLLDGTYWGRPKPGRAQ